MFDNKYQISWILLVSLSSHNRFSITATEFVVQDEATKYNGIKFDVEMKRIEYSK